MTRILFENHHLYYLSNFLPIIAEFRGRSGYEVFASMPCFINQYEQEIFYDSCSKLGITAIREDNEDLRLSALKNLKIDVVVVGNIGQLHKILRTNTFAVLVYHGIGLKQTYYHDIDDRIDLRAVESESRLEELLNLGYNNLVLTGFTKCDPLSRPLKNQSRRLSEMGLNANLRTILYAPSFYPSSQEKIIPFLRSLEFEQNIIIKLHNFSWHQKKYRYQSKVMSALAEQNRNIFLIPPEDYDIISYYPFGDILISDISSTLFEFLPLNRPIIMAECFTLRLKHRIFFKRYLRRMDLRRMEMVDFAYRLNNPEDLPSLVYHALDYPEELEEKRLKAQSKYLFKTDGRAAFRLVDAIERKRSGNKK